MGVDIDGLLAENATAIASGVLSLPGADLADGGLAALAARALPPMREVNLARNRLTTVGVRALLTAKWLVGVERLDLAGNPGLGDIALQELGRSPALFQLRRLVTSGSGARAQGYVALVGGAGEGRGPPVEGGASRAGGARTESQGRSADSAREAGALRPSSEGRPGSAEGIPGASPPLWAGGALEELDGGYDVVGDVGAAALATLPALRILVLPRAAVGGAGARALLAHPTLENVELSENTLAGAFLGLRLGGQLHTVRARKAGLTPIDFVALARLDVAGLRVLELEGNRAGDDGVLALAKAKWLPKVERLGLAGTGASASAVAKLKAAWGSGRGGLGV
jgi:hypothetical protein